MADSGNAGRYDPDELLAAMRKDPDSPWARDLAYAIERATPPPLTAHELRMLSGFSVGLNEKGVAELCGVTFQTVHVAMKSAKRKLRAKNLPHAVALALRAGLID